MYIKQVYSQGGLNVNYVFLCRDSAIQVYLMAFAAPSVQK